VARASTIEEGPNFVFERARAFGRIPAILRHCRAGAPPLMMQHAISHPTPPRLTHRAAPPANDPAASARLIRKILSGAAPALRGVEAWVA